MAKSLNSRITLVQALPAESAQAARANVPLGDVLESSYLQTTAAEIKKRYQIEPGWDVLHGEAGDAICRYVNGMEDTLLANDLPRSRRSRKGPSRQCRRSVHSQGWGADADLLPGALVSTRSSTPHSQPLTAKRERLSLQQ